MKLKENLFIHDYFQNYGGGERLILSLIKNKDTLLSSFIDKKIKNLIKTKKKIILQKNNFLGTKIKKLLTPIIFFFHKKNKKYLNYFVSGNYSVFLNLPKNGNKIYYCHSLPKLFYEFKDFYSYNNFFLRIFIFLFGDIFKFFYIKKINNFDKIVVNSNYTNLKLKKYYKKKIYKIYPPIQNFIINKKNISDNKIFFLSNSRHEIEKNIDIIIKTFNKIKKYNLIIISNGTQTNHLKKLAKNNKKIKFLGLVKEEEYKKLLNKCIATINISRNEDFGMAAIEGMSAGKPAIVINEGGYKETCKNNYNSFVINRNNIENNLYSILKNFDLKKCKKMRRNCKITAKKFSIDIFREEINKLFF